MPPDTPRRFGPYALAVLWRLARQAEQMVTTAALLAAVWADTAVTEGLATPDFHAAHALLAAPSSASAGPLPLCGVGDLDGFASCVLASSRGNTGLEQELQDREFSHLPCGGKRRRLAQRIHLSNRIAP